MHSYPGEKLEIVSEEGRPLQARFAEKGESRRFPEPGASAVEMTDVITVEDDQRCYGGLNAQAFVEGGYRGFLDEDGGWSFGAQAWAFHCRLSPDTVEELRQFTAAQLVWRESLLEISVPGPRGRRSPLAGRAQA